MKDALSVRFLPLTLHSAPTRARLSQETAESSKDTSHGLKTALEISASDDEHIAPSNGATKKIALKSLQNLH